MDRLKNIIISILSVLCILSMIVMIFSISYKPNKVEFVPPKFESAVIKGRPELQPEYDWSEVYQEGMNYRVGICTKVTVYEDVADVYFSNTKDNMVWLKLRVLDEDNNIIGETGLIKPDEYVKAVNLNGNFQDGQKIKLKIMAYEPETYYSEGSIILNTIIKRVEYDGV